MTSLRVPFALLLTLGVVTCQQSKNVLFLVSDDMRPQLGAYAGPDFPAPLHPRMHTPNLDALARRSLLLKKAYVQMAVCNPSRASLLTSRRPDTTHVYDLVTYWRTAGGNYTTIPQYFKQHGYLTAGMGKIFHPGKKPSNNDDPISWTEPYFHANAPYYDKYSRLSWTSVNTSEWRQHPLEDMMIAQKAIQKLHDLGTRESEQPFFLAVGFHRPHLPFVVPDKYFQYYPVEDVKPPSNPYAPVGMPEVAWSISDELRYYTDIGKKYGYGNINSTLPDHVTVALRRAYYAAVSYVDDLIGQVLLALDESGLANSTVVSFWGDHGWQLGEHGEWAKHTNFELATHAPMMLAVPGLTDGGIIVEELTEFVDLFPTLIEAVGLPVIPVCPEENATQIETCTEGASFLPFAKGYKGKWKSASFSQYPRMSLDGNIYMGYTMRTQQYRYTEWVNFVGYPNYGTDWTDIFFDDSIELYDHATDPEENVNRAFHSGYEELRKALSKQLRAGWRAARPQPGPGH